MIQADIHQLVVRRKVSAVPIKAGQRTDFDHAGARVTVTHRGPLHRAARRITT